MSIQTTAIAAAVVASVAFGAGWSVNGWRLNAIFNKAQVAATEEFDRRQKALYEEHAKQLERDTLARVALSRRLQESRSTTAELTRKLESVQLSPKSPVIKTVIQPGECKDGQITPEVVLANPFSPDFVRLWNTSASGIIARETGAE